MLYAPHEFTLGLGGVMARLGQLDGPRGPRTAKWQVAHVAGLIASHGFPAPLPLAGSTAPTARSRWLTQAVDHWLGSFMPPGATAAAERAARQAAGDDMDEAAANIARRMNERGMSVVNGGAA